MFRLHVYSSPASFRSQPGEAQRAVFMSRRIVILGSTGSIGENTLAVVRHLHPELQPVGLAAGCRADRLAEQAAEFGCRWVFVADPCARNELSSKLPPGCTNLRNREELCARVAADDVDLVLCAVVGTAGLEPVLAAVRAGKDIALASKEILVLAGELVTGEAARCGVRILPVDSEHCALFQCLEGERANNVRRLVITASGGPFHGCDELDLGSVTPAMALRHPTWEMGRKVTIDSATLMNKGLEVIEARWLFDVPGERIETVIHPQAVIHSMVEFSDGSVLAQMGYPDMRLPIQFCLTYPRRGPLLVRPFDFSEAVALHFEPPNHDRFPAIRLAEAALAAGGTLTAVYNAANEVAVARFCAGECRFPEIWETVARTMDSHDVVPHPSLDEILAADRWAREAAAGCAAKT